VKAAIKNKQTANLPDDSESGTGMTTMEQIEKVYLSKKISLERR